MAGVCHIRYTCVNGVSANGRKVLECYVVGMDPEVATNDFRIVSFPMKADGTPDLAGIVFDPPQAQWNVPATYKVKGAVSLEGPWGGGAGGRRRYARRRSRGDRPTDAVLQGEVGAAVGGGRNKLRPSRREWRRRENGGRGKHDPPARVVSEDVRFNQH